MPDPLSSAAAGVELAGALFELAEKQGLIEKLLLAFKKKPRVLILGPTGSGKTNFLDSLTAERSQPIPRAIRTQYPSRKVLTLLKKRAFRFVDTPGDTDYKDVRVQEIRESLSAKGGISGVINVVSYGYHEYQLARSDVFKPDGSISPDYLEKHRGLELDQLDEWTPLLGSPITVDWLITLVTKADLWWDQRKDVLAYYQKGPYRARLGQAVSLNQRVLMYSSHTSKFYGEAPHSGYFDDEDRKKLQQQFLEAVLAALLQHSS
jgi:hypothetical protein